MIEQCSRPLKGNVLIYSLHTNSASDNFKHLRVRFDNQNKQYIEKLKKPLMQMDFNSFLGKLCTHNKSIIPAIDQQPSYIARSLLNGKKDVYVRLLKVLVLCHLPTDIRHEQYVQLSILFFKV